MQSLPVVSPRAPAYQVGQQLYGLQYEGQVTGYQPLPEDRIIRMPAEYWRYADSTLQTQLPEDQEMQMQQHEELLRQQMMLQEHLEAQQREQEELRVELEQRLLEKQQLLDQQQIEHQQMLQQQQLWHQQQLEHQRLMSQSNQQVMPRLPAEEAVFTSHPYGDSSVPGRDVPAPRPTNARAGDGDNNDQLQSLLESLEARIDLMAQMQNTRVAIQRRAQALEEMRAKENVGDSLAMYDPSFAAQQQDPLGAFGQREAQGVDLWSYLQEQRDCISQLTREVEGMRNQMKIISGGVLQPQLEDYSGAAFQPMEGQLWGQQLEDLPSNKVVDLERELERQLVDERRQQVLAAQMRMQERSKLYAEISEAAQRSTDGADGLQTLLALPTSADTRAPPQTIDLGRSLETHARTGLEQDWSPPPPKLFGEPPLVASLSSDMCGVNVELSEDGYTATRARGCRQSVALGSAPLVRQASGWYFEVVIQETVSGWVGGLGIGVTRTPPGTVPRVPDKAWRLPGTCIVGYWGCVFLDGSERKTHWRPDDLQAGQRVGFLVTGDGRGDIILFVDDQPVVHVPGAMLAKDMNITSIAVGVPEPMFPIVDIFAATRTVALIRRATPPPRPWDVSNPLVRPASPTATVDNMSLGRSSM
mmetsp:Transcript_62270/g.115574  ORF Transcript_62270/g.115574 Transcript_62270/m.115574 type:complete len:644 (-) Transcript_62270:85-2016(-)